MRRIEIDRTTGATSIRGFVFRRAAVAVLAALVCVCLLTFLTRACRSSLALRVERLEQIHVLEHREGELREELSRLLLEADPRYAL